MKPLMSERTEAAVERYLSSPSQPLVLTGVDGAGKYYLAQWVAGQQTPHVITVRSEQDKQSISIDQIRSLYTQTRTGTNLAVIVRDAHQMGSEAQNAFLKLLEEPPENTFFILTVVGARSLLPTITSRSQQIEVAPVSVEQLEALNQTGEKLDSSEFNALVFSLGARPGTLSNLLTNETARSQHRQNLEHAKKFYASSPYERHTQLIDQKFERVQFSAMLETLAVIVQSLIETRTQDPKLRARLMKQASLLQEVGSNITNRNGSVKIHASRLAQEL